MQRVALTWEAGRQVQGGFLEEVVFEPMKGKSELSGREGGRAF